jgi:hypothetical protein
MEIVGLRYLLELSRPNIKIEYHPLLAVRDFLLNILVTTLSEGHFLHPQPEDEHILVKSDPFYEFIFLKYEMLLPENSNILLQQRTYLKATLPQRTPQNEVKSRYICCS